MKGLRNLGQTCYFNAAVQCMLYCPNLTNYFLAGCDQDVNPRKKLASAFSTTYAQFARDYWTSRNMDEPNDASAVYDAFTRGCRDFDKGQQHDAHEALMNMLDKLHEGLCRMKPMSLGVAHRPELCQQAWQDKHPASVISEVFRGQLEMSVQGSGYSSVTHEHFTSLSLAITDSTSLVQCLQRHLSTEELTDFKVDGNIIPATLTKKFTYLPRILIVHLKRFDDTDKLNKFIDYSSELNLGPFTAVHDHHYQLFAVCLHRGDMDQGHYVACCEVKGHWYYMDDDSVAKMTNINDIIQRDAYVLMYKRL